MLPLPSDLSPSETAKFLAARRAARMVEDGMKVGLGTGSTAAWLVRALGARRREEGLRFQAVATSTATANLAREEGIEVKALDEAGWLDLTIDGADELDGDLTLIKGGGGALLQEKIVATASERMVVIADASKHVATLGAFPLPVEVLGFGLSASRRLIEEALAGQDVDGHETRLRMAGDRPFVTDEGNHIVDLPLARIGNARQLSLALNQIAGVVENGLFIDICDAVVTGYADGRVRMVDPAVGTIEERNEIRDGEAGNAFANL